MRNVGEYIVQGSLIELSQILLGSLTEEDVAGCDSHIQVLLRVNHHGNLLSQTLLEYTTTWILLVLLYEGIDSLLVKVGEDLDVLLCIVIAYVQPELQFWLNVSDDDAEKYIKIFTDLDKETIDALVEEHKQDPGRRVLQKRLAEEVTVMVHSQEDLDMAIAASNILFGKATKENLAQLDEATLNDVFANVPHYDLDKNLLGGTAVDLFNQEGMQIFPSKSEMRKLVKGGGVSLNKEKLNAFDQVITAEDLIDGKYLLVQKGKKNYFLITVK